MSNSKCYYHTICVVMSNIEDNLNLNNENNYSCDEVSETWSVEQYRLYLMDHRHQTKQPLSDYNSSTYHQGAYNFSIDDVIKILLERKQKDSNVSKGAEAALIAVYSVLIAAGLTANLLVSFVVARRAQMHTARNLYIVNLTVSDITLCIICMPFTLVTILRRQWTLGSALCKLVPMLQGTNIMVSIGTITVIALDRYFTIVRRSSQDASSNRRRVIVSIVLIWLLSALATLPMFFFQVVEPVAFPVDPDKFQRVVLYEVCIERWPSRSAQLVYTICVLLLQSVLPALVVGTVHARIAAYLHTHAKTQRDSRRARKELQRNRRTTLLLSGIAVLFIVSWLPQGLCSVLADVIFQKGNSHSLYMAVAVCHITAMTSAVSNPIVYGWLNSNIRHEFLQLLPARCAATIQRTDRTAVTGCATTAVEDVTTRTHLNNHSVAHNNHHNPNQQDNYSQHHRESVTLLLAPTSNKVTAAMSPSTAVSVL